VATIDDDIIISIAHRDKMHFNGKEAILLDREIRKLLKDDDLLELKCVECDEGNISYSIYYKKQKNMAEDGAKDLWSWGFTLKHSVLGHYEPSISMEVSRAATGGMAYLPAKLFLYELPSASNFEGRQRHIEEFIAEPPKAGWTELGWMLTRLKSPASYREVSEARNRLLKLKLDKFDTETSDRVSDALQWARIVKAYDVKAKDKRPPKNWFARASTPLKLMDVYNTMSREATHAPNTLDPQIRKNLLTQAGALLAGNPDLYNLPPKIDWSAN